MSRNKTYYRHFMLAFFIFCTQVTSIAQAVLENKRDIDSAKKSGEFALIAYVGGGISFFTGKAGTPADLHSNISTTNPIGSLRIMWHPDHLLRIGLETGWWNFYSYTIEDNNVKGKVNVQSIPILLVFSMPVFNRFNIFAGPGSYMITSRLSYGAKVSSRTVSLGWMAAASYVYPINDKLGIATEFKWLNSWETKDQSLTLQIQLRWKFLTW